MQANRFQIDSRYPMDKIVFLKQFSITTDNTGMYDGEITHGLGDIPFCNAVISFDNWNTTYQAGTSRMARQYYSEEFNISSDDTKVKISCLFLERPNKTAQIRVWGVYNSTSTATASPTRQLSNNNFVLSSKYNYLKLLKDGIVDVSDGQKLMSHNLGYKPIVELWADFAYDDKGWTYYNRPDCFENNFNGQAAKITNTNLVLNDGGIVLKVSRFYYRIYCDAAE